jgi:hypothetical protein
VDDVRSLTLFADCLFRQRGLESSRATTGEDLGQEAVRAVLIGLEDKGNGRRPRLVDVADKDAFLNYLRGIVHSKFNALMRPVQPPTIPMADAENTCSSAAASPSAEAAMTDLKNEILRRVRARSSRHLATTITAWEHEFADCDRIPILNGSRKNAFRVRRIAAQVVKELDEKQ